jgi:hypothetical protein
MIRVNIIRNSCDDDMIRVLKSNKELHFKL